MIFKTSIAVEELVKSAGGVTASKNKSRAYFKVRTNPRNPQTSSQSEARSILTTFSKKYRTLTNDQISAWDEFAKTQIGRRYLGVAGKLSGINAYVRVNANLALIGQPELSSPPSAANFNTIQLDTVAYMIVGETRPPRGIYPVFDSNPLAANQTLVVKASPTLSKGRRAKTTETRVIATLSTIPTLAGTGEGARTVYTVDVLQEWANKFANGNKPEEAPIGNYQIEVYVIDNKTGLASNKVNWIGDLTEVRLNTADIS